MRVGHEVPQDSENLRTYAIDNTHLAFSTLGMSLFEPFSRLARAHFRMAAEGKGVIILLIQACLDVRIAASLRHDEDQSLSD